MLFNSLEFIFLFLPVSFAVYFLFNRARQTEAAKAWLVLTSLFFYSWWNVAYLPLILGSMLFNFSIGKLLGGQTSLSFFPKRKIILFFGVTANVALLGYFKYTDFLIENTNLLLGTNMNPLGLALPLAISFFTFQQIAYLVDSYRGETREYSLLNYAVFVCFFPQLIAGPIVHHSQMMSQFSSLRKKVINPGNIALGLFIFSIGLFKKVVIADTFSSWATAGFDGTHALHLLEAWATSLSYTFQLYFDFSGYCDMAVGAALLFNISLPVNFNSPYKALNIQDFWRRWHMTLSGFLRDYVYIPLGGSRMNSFRTYQNLMYTFIIGGIWHGAGWTFVFWGALHGLALCIHRFWSGLTWRMHTLLAWFLTFNFVNISWVFFRAKEWEDAIKVLKGMAGISGVSLPAALPAALKEPAVFLANDSIHFVSGNLLAKINGSSDTWLFLLSGFAITLFFKNAMSYLETFKPTRLTTLHAGTAFVCSIIFLNRHSEFLYFNF